MSRDRYTLETSRATADALEAALASAGLTIKPGSLLEQAHLNIFDVLYKKSDPQSIDRSDFRSLFRDLIGVTELGTQLVATSSSNDFAKLTPHLRLLNKGSALQNRRAESIDQATNKVFELLVACWAMAQGRDLELDDPDGSSGGRNPDVLTTIGGRRWGFACKVLHSKNPLTLGQNLTRGLEQLSQSDAEVGVVVINAKNIIEHERYWNVLNIEAWEKGAELLFDCQPDPQEPFDRLSCELDGMVEKLRGEIGKVHLRDMFDSHPKSIPAFLLWGHAVSCVLLSGQPAPTSVRTLMCSVVEPLGKAETQVISALNDAAMRNP